jgi:adenosylhomocysteine nucleosidase
MPVVFLAALPQEAGAIRPLLAGRRRLSLGGVACDAGSMSGHPVLLAASGIGIAAARAAAGGIIAAASPSAIVAIGFCGGLRAGLRAGDLVLATEVHEPPPPDGEGPRTWQPDPDLLAAARAAAGESHAAEGRLATVRRVLATSAEKRALAERTGAVAADMESGGIARAANAGSVPVLYARAVVDDLDFDFPLDVGRLVGPDGRLRPLKALGAILPRPSAWKGLAELRARSGAAAGALARFASALAAVLGHPVA